MSVDQSLEKLRILALCARGFPSYYGKLIEREEPVLRAAAATWLLNMEALPYAMLPALLPLAKHGAVRNRAINFLGKVGEYGWVDRILAVPCSEERQALIEKFYRAETSGQNAEAAELARALYLADGTPDWLRKAIEHANEAGGWRNAIAGQVEYILTSPSDPGGPHGLLNSLAIANEFALVQQVIGIFQEVGAYPMECAVFRAKVELKNGNYNEAVAALPKDVQNIISEPLLVSYWDALAQAHRGQRNFHEAYRCYQRMNEVGVPRNIRAEGFYEGVSYLSKLHFENSKSAAARADVVMALGFPRSGTTLLENALAAHPSIETFEESPSFNVAERLIKSFGKNVISAQDSAAVRSAYYDALLRRSRKPAATVKIDKVPVRSAHAAFLHNLFPGQKYIFSIRHPYDVVLSCFIQSFKPNPAMENFRTFAGACRLYDFSMSQWFSAFAMNSPVVHYVRYEELVNQIEGTFSGVCKFLGVKMDPKMLQFSERAQTRPVRTPSYAKVRQGVSIGVQSSWKDFSFLFESQEAKCLERWVKHFGYTA